MDDDSIITDRLRHLVPPTGDEVEHGDHTIVLDESSIMETMELEQLLDPGAESMRKITDTDIHSLEEIAAAMGVVDEDSLI